MLVAIALTGLGVVVFRTAEAICLPDWSGAQRIRLANNEQTALGDPPVPYRVHVDVGRDFAPKVFPRLSFSQHPMDAILSISAATPGEMSDVSVSCVHVSRGAETWSRRPLAYDVTTSPGNPSAGAWRVFLAADGPEWGVGEEVNVEIWLAVNGKRYIVALGPFTLYRGL